MSTDGIVFEAELAVLLPDLLHLTSMHPTHQTSVERAGEVAQILTTRDRHEHLCWLLLEEYYIPAARALNPSLKAINFTPAIPGPDGRLHDISVERADPEHKIAVWYARAVANGDRDMARATFANLPDQWLIPACRNYLAAAANQVRFAVLRGKQSRGPCSLTAAERCS